MLQFLKLFGNEIIMISLVIAGFEYAHSVVMCLAIVAGIIVNLVKFYWLIEDRKKHQRWKEPSKYYAKKPKFK